MLMLVSVLWMEIYSRTATKMTSYTELAWKIRAAVHKTASDETRYLKKRQIPVGTEPRVYDDGNK